MKYQEKRELLLKVFEYWEGHSPATFDVYGGGITCHILFMELESINFTVEKISRTQMLSKSKNKKPQLDNDNAMKKNL